MHYLSPQGCGHRFQRSANCLKDGFALRPTFQTDFSVVLFRSDFVLISEKNYMKAHKNQWVCTIPYPPECLAEATSRGQTMAPEAQKPSQ